MGNMAYCRFYNTLHDLKECTEAIENEDELSEEETKAKNNLIEECENFLAAVKEAD